MHNSNIGAEANLDPTTKRMSVNGSNHWYRNLLPDPGDLLTKVGDATVGHGARIAFAGILGFCSAGHLLE